MPRLHLIIISIVFASLVQISPQAYSHSDSDAPSGSTADHRQFEQLKRDFKTAPEVTRECLGCHTEAAREIHKTLHWTWAFDNELTGQMLGKKNVINNFCIATATNWPRCTSCHIGFGWEDNQFDLTSEESVDCLVCHDTTGTYKKFPTDAGHPNYVAKEWPPKSGKIRQPPDLNYVAQHVGAPDRDNCGACHFYGGGGDGVKHGHLDSSLSKPSRELDVHMNAKGLDFSCQTCHTTGSHQVAGSRYAPRSADHRGIIIPGKGYQDRASCESCHGRTPHDEDASSKLNQHTNRIACTTCHIPEFARGGRKTKMWWDWSSAGKTGSNGKPLVIKDAQGYDSYHFKKGEFKWQENVVPEYRWFNGHIDYALLEQTFDDTGIVPINQIHGSASDEHSRIWPFKIMRGIQPYDRAQKLFAVPHLFGKDSDAYWKNFNWESAIRNGMQERGLAFSGELGFVETEYLWPVTHMVAPGEQSLSCESCHQRNGRLSNLDDIYIPASSRMTWLDRIGWLLVIGTLFGVLAHGLGRWWTSRRRKREA